jgi:cation diffusion facilitator CzcD-associated flavoprotein CzcO
VFYRVLYGWRKHLTEEDFYDRNGISKHTKLSHKVRNAEWNSEEGKWKVEVEDLETGKAVKDECHILINATGFLNKWTWPAIKGFETFKLPKVHSADWNDEIDFKDKTVAVIGTGSSAIQVSNLDEST